VDHKEARGEIAVHAPQSGKTRTGRLAEEWRWSSYGFYALDEAGTVRVNEGWTEISFRGVA